MTSTFCLQSTCTPVKCGIDAPVAIGGHGHTAASLQDERAVQSQARHLTLHHITVVKAAPMHVQPKSAAYFAQ